MDESNELQQALDAIARTYDPIDRALFAARLAAASCGGEHRRIMMQVLELMEPIHDERHRLEDAVYERFSDRAPSAP